jgi:hypothetical protein
VFHPTNGTMLLGNDGGIFQVANRTPAAGHFTACPPVGVGSGLSFQPLNNGYGVTQFYYNPNGWVQLLGGDGGAVAVDPTNPDVIFAENYGLSIQKSTDGGGTWVDAVTGITDNGFAFIAPFVMDPSARAPLDGRQLGLAHRQPGGLVDAGEHDPRLRRERDRGLAGRR